jgi:hypothetical protein
MINQFFINDNVISFFLENKIILSLFLNLLSRIVKNKVIKFLSVCEVLNLNYGKVKAGLLHISYERLFQTRNDKLKQYSI